MPPGALTASVQACFSCQNSGRGYCMSSGSCEWLSLSPCGNEPSDFVTPSEATEKILWENGVFPHDHVCFAVVAPRAAWRFRLFLRPSGIAYQIKLNFLMK